MPSYPLTALVLRKTKLGETDMILTLLAEDGRQVRGVAKGLRKPGSRFGGRLEPYSVVDLLMHSGRSLEIISEARSVETNAALREDLDRMSAAAVVVDLLDKIAVEGQGEPRLFALATKTLRVMAEAAPQALPALVVAFLLKAMAMHGYRPELDTCVSCGCDIGEVGGFSFGDGGVLCGPCARLDSGSVALPEVARLWLRQLLGATMSEVACGDTPKGAARDCLGLMKGFVTYHLRSRLKALDFYSV